MNLAEEHLEIQKQAQTSITLAWSNYKKAERYGLEFGKTLYEWRKKFKAQGRKGRGLLPILEQVEIPVSTAYFWIERYEIASGKKAKKKQIEYETPASKEDFRQLIRGARTGRGQPRVIYRPSYLDDAYRVDKTRETIPLPPSHSRLSSFAILEFFDLLGLEALHAAWKKQLILFHPDTGGDAIKAARLNELWTEIKKIRGDVVAAAGVMEESR